MHIERMSLTNFRCFGPATEAIHFSPCFTTFIGSNGSGKTAAMQALLRMFGVTGDQRRVRRQDFHVPTEEAETPSERTLAIEVILDFPELANDQDGEALAVPEFFHQMAADEGGALKCRLRLEATWQDDGSADGSIEERRLVIRTLAPDFGDDDCLALTPTDRARIQMIYVPATRDGVSQVTAFLRGRLWRAIQWSEDLQNVLGETGETLNRAFAVETGVSVVSEAVEKRWQEVHTAGTDATPVFRPIDLRFQEFVRKVEVVFRPDESGRDRELEDLSDGQRSLLHTCMTAATLDIESEISRTRTAGFKIDDIPFPALTLIAIEEPENNLAPFFLSRIVRQIEDLTKGLRAQAVISSHSPSIMARVEPENVRHFRLVPETRFAMVRQIILPENVEEGSKYIREAVRAYPELYFARFVILGEGPSEEIALPRLAQAMDFPIDRSFVAVVPLGGRHVNHMWKLLTELDIPFATLLDLDWGRNNAGWSRIKYVCDQLRAIGIDPRKPPESAEENSDLKDIQRVFDEGGQDNWGGIEDWIRHLECHHIFFSQPLDLDLSMLGAYPLAYRNLDTGMRGPSGLADNAKSAVLGDGGNEAAYPSEWDDDFLWYRYLFLGRGKPGTHVRILSEIEYDELAANSPSELRRLLSYVAGILAPTIPDAESS